MKILRIDHVAVCVADLDGALPSWLGLLGLTAGPREFVEMGEGGRTACAGPVFHWRPEFEQTNGFPKDFDGWLLFWDWERPTIRCLARVSRIFTGASSLPSMDPPAGISRLAGVSVGYRPLGKPSARK